MNDRILNYSTGLNSQGRSTQIGRISVALSFIAIVHLLVGAFCEMTYHASLPVGLDEDAVGYPVLAISLQMTGFGIAFLGLVLGIVSRVVKKNWLAWIGIVANMLALGCPIFHGTLI